MQRRSFLSFAAASFAIAVLFGAATASKKHVVSIGDQGFNPDTLSISAGDTVEWTNDDDRDHAVRARDGSFASDNLGNGAKFRFTFKKAGKFQYSCALHPREKGLIVVSGE